MINLAIVGAGIYGQQIMHWANITGKYKVVGFFDDFATVGDNIKDIRVIGNLNDINIMYKNGFFDELFIAIGYKHFIFKGNLINKLKVSVPLATIIAEHSYLDQTAHIGKNVFIGPGCIINENCNIEDGVSLIQSVNVSHDSTIGFCSYCAPSVNIAGMTAIGSNCFLGIGSTIIDNISICPNVIIGASSTVIRDIHQEGTYVGIPSRKIK